MKKYFLFIFCSFLMSASFSQQIDLLQYIPNSSIVFYVDMNNLAQKAEIESFSSQLLKGDLKKNKFVRSLVLDDDKFGMDFRSSVIGCFTPYLNGTKKGYLCNIYVPLKNPEKFKKSMAKLDKVHSTQVGDELFYYSTDNVLDMGAIWNNEFVVFQGNLNYSYIEEYDEVEYDTTDPLSNKINLNQMILSIQKQPNSIQNNQNFLQFWSQKKEIACFVDPLITDSLGNPLSMIFKQNLDQILKNFPLSYNLSFDDGRCSLTFATLNNQDNHKTTIPFDTKLLGYDDNEALFSLILNKHVLKNYSKNLINLFNDYLDDPIKLIIDNLDTDNQLAFSLCVDTSSEESYKWFTVSPYTDEVTTFDKKIRNMVEHHNFVRDSLKAQYIKDYTNYYDTVSEDSEIDSDNPYYIFYNSEYEAELFLDYTKRGTASVYTLYYQGELDSNSNEIQIDANKKYIIAIDNGYIFYGNHTSNMDNFIARKQNLDTPLWQNIMQNLDKALYGRSSKLIDIPHGELDEEDIVLYSLVNYIDFDAPDVNHFNINIYNSKPEENYLKSIISSLIKIMELSQPQ